MKSDDAVFQEIRAFRIYDCYAAERRLRQLLQIVSFSRGEMVFECQNRKNPLSRVFVKFKIVTLNLNWCPEEDSNFHDLAVTST